MTKDIFKKFGKNIVLKIISVIIGLWVLITVIDAVRFFVSDKQVSPLICLEYNGCKCYEWRQEIGMGYSFDYEYYSMESYSANKPDRAVYCFFGMKHERK